MKIITFNVNGIRSAYRKGFSDWIKNEDPDIVCLQEVKAKELPLGSSLFDFDLGATYHQCINPAAKEGYSGVAVYSKEAPLKVTKIIGSEKFDQEGRILELEFDGFRLINVYIPHGRRDKKNLNYKLQVYDLLIQKLKTYKNRKIILAGDFNVAHQEIDLARPSQNRDNTMFTPKERSQIDRLLAVGFVDTFRELNKEPGNYTWWPYSKDLRDRNIGWRIDYIFVSNTLRQLIQSAFILKDVQLSDHCPFGIDLTLALKK